MVASWTPLTLSEARGFISSYKIAYSPILTSESQQVFFKDACADSANIIITGLNESLAYSFVVLAVTSGGEGIQSDATVVEILVKPSGMMM